MATKIFFSAIFFIGIAVVLSAPRTEKRDVTTFIPCITQQLSKFVTVAQDSIQLHTEIFGVFNSTFMTVKNCFDQGASAAPAGSNTPNTNVITACISLSSTQLLPQLEKIVQDAESLGEEIENVWEATRTCFTGPPAPAAPPTS